VCGRYGLSTPSSQIIEQKELFEETKKMMQKYSGRHIFFPSQKIPVIKSRNITEELAWGLKPDWSKQLIINARREKLLDSPYWKRFIKKNRCLIPASFFMEWQTIGKKKTPWTISLPKREIFCFAGLFAEEQGEFQAAIITEEANSLMKKIHNHGPNKERQPVILSPDTYEAWLDEKISPEELLERVGHTLEEEMQAEEEVERGLF